MTIDRLFLLFAAAVGIAAGAVVVGFPASRSAAVSPYFWVLLSIAAFDLATFAYGRGAPGTVIAPMTRFAGFAVAIAMLFIISRSMGVELNLF